MREMQGSMIRWIAKRTLVAGGIRFAGMGLSLAFFLAVARAAGAEGFGLFSLLLSLATVLGYGALLGQHIAILRFWPMIEDRHGRPAADRFLGVSFCLAVFACMGVGLAFGILAISGFPEISTSIFWAGALTMALAFAEFSANALRAKGHVILALGPRDIVWRVLVVATMLAWPASLPVHEALAITALLLALAIAPQYVVLLRDGYRSRNTRLPNDARRALFKATPVLWLSSSTTPLTEYATTIVVGLALGPLAAGIYFAADRLAKLLIAGFISVEQVVAPDLSRAWHRGDLAMTGRIISLASLIGFAAATIGALFYLAFGPLALALFDPVFADGYPILLVLTGGQMVHALLGANAMLLTMAGAERTLLAIRLVWGALAILLAFTGAALSGILGVAIASTFVLIGWNISVTVACRARLGVRTALPLGHAPSACLTPQRR